MSRARNLADLLDSNGDVVSGALDNVPPSNDASALTTGTLSADRIGSGSITAAKLADTYLTGIGDGTVTAAKLASTLDLSGKTVTLPSGTGGKLLQVVSTTKTDTFSTTSNSYTDVTGLSVSITPSSASSKILVMAMISEGTADAAMRGFRLMRNSTAIAIGASAGSRNQSSVSVYQGNSDYVSTASVNPINYLDSPSTTSAVIYKIQAHAQDGTTLYVNRNGADADNNSYGHRTVSTITVMEIAA
jgi:hypothetical protein